MTTKAQRMMKIGDTVNVGETERIASAIVGGTRARERVGAPAGGLQREGE